MKGNLARAAQMFVWGCLAYGVVASAGPLFAVAPDLIRPEQIAPYNLELAWFNQVQIDPARGKIVDWLLDRDTLFVVTDSAVIQALDPETGRSLWATQVGSPNFMTLKPTVDHHLVGVVNGSTIYILNRYTGVILWTRETEGAVGAGPAISSSHVYVPMIRGKIESYRLEWATQQIAEAAGGLSAKTAALESPGAAPQPAVPAVATPAQPAAAASGTVPSPGAAAEATPSTPAEPVDKKDFRLDKQRLHGLFVMSWGKVLHEPRVTYADRNRERVAWPTDRQLLFVAELDARTEMRFSVVYFLEIAGGEIVAPPSIRPGDPNDPMDDDRMLFVTASNGFVYALREHDGKLLWRFSTGEPIKSSPGLIKDDLFVTTETGGLYRVNALTGQLVWLVKGIRQFVSASEDRVYAVDALENLVILDYKTGSRQGQFNVARYPMRCINTQTDRIYLADRSGLIQCLREIGRVKPVQHFVPPPAAPETAEGQPQGQPKTPQTQEQAPQQPAQPAPPQPAGENPFE